MSNPEHEQNLKTAQEIVRQALQNPLWDKGIHELPSVVKKFHEPDLPWGYLVAAYKQETDLDPEEIVRAIGYYVTPHDATFAMLRGGYSPDEAAQAIQRPYHIPPATADKIVSEVVETTHFNPEIDSIAS